MDSLLFWVIIGILGFVLYISPGFFIYRMYESFAAPIAPTAPTQQAATATTVNATGATAVNLLPTATAPQHNASPENALNNLMQLLNTPASTESPTATAPVPQSNNGNAVPLEHSSTRSQPESARATPAPSESLAQGDLYKTTTPKDPQPGLQGMLGAMGTQPRIPAERIVYVDRRREEERRDDERRDDERRDDDRCDRDREEERYERPARNPNCPDMRDYIRKDSIPCWGCKLR